MSFIVQCGLVQRVSSQRFTSGAPGVEPGIAAPIGGEAHDDAGYRERAAYEILLAFQRIV